MLTIQMKYLKNGLINKPFTWLIISNGIVCEYDTYE